MPPLPWAPLTHQQLDPDVFPLADPYLRIGDATNFIDHFSHTKGRRLVIEL